MKRSSMMLPPWFMIFRTMFSAGWHISQTEVHLYLLPTQGLMSSHRVFRLDLIRQHPATSGLGLVKGWCCFLDNFWARLPRIKRNLVGYLWHFQHWVVAKRDIVQMLCYCVWMGRYHYCSVSRYVANVQKSISASMPRHSLAFSLSDSCIKWLRCVQSMDDAEGVTDLSMVSDLNWYVLSFIKIV